MLRSSGQRPQIPAQILMKPRTHWSHRASPMLAVVGWLERIGLRMHPLASSCWWRQPTCCHGMHCASPLLTAAGVLEWVDLHQAICLEMGTWRTRSLHPVWAHCRHMLQE